MGSYPCSFTRRKRALEFVLVGLILQIAPLAHASDDLPPRFALRLSQPFSPYEYVQFELKAHGAAYIAVLTKRLVGGFDEFQGLGLVTEDQYWEAVRSIDGCGLDVVEQESRTETSSPSSQFAIEFGDEHIVYNAPAASPDHGSAIWCAGSVLVDTYHSVGETVVFRNAFFEAGEYGELMVDSVPAARIVIDGVDTHLTTPARAIRLTLGTHQVRFINQSMGIDRSYEVTIEEGHTTRLDVELR